MTNIVKKFIKFATQERFMEKENNMWCVRCTLANAKPAFDNKFNLPSISIEELFKQSFVTGIEEIEEDKILMEARDYLKTFNFGMLFRTKKEAKKFMLFNV